MLPQDEIGDSQPKMILWRLDIFAIPNRQSSQSARRTLNFAPS